jgi:O-antigen biosynthesis protein
LADHRPRPRFEIAAEWQKAMTAAITDDDIALVAASGLFDPDYYATEVGAVLQGHEAAIRHYLTAGWLDFANPGPEFSTGYYLAENRDVQETAAHPLLHYIRLGRAEGRRGTRWGGPRAPSQRRIPAPLAPTETEWAALAPCSAEAPVVDVIVPVYRGYAETLRTIHSVLAAPQRTAYRLVVIDDCSPDIALSDALHGLAKRGLIELHKNEQNLGFVATCNRGILLRSDRDVVLLNADTEVYNDWLDRLRAAVLRDFRIGTATPLSNNAEICSYPRFVRDNWTQLELNGAMLDRLAADVNSGWTCDVPTGVGFCMYIRRCCVDDVGMLDTETFGRGYGEENDFCCRAAARGWRNILAADIFVRHHGGTSFGSEKKSRVEHALRRLTDIHPGYPRAVEEFIQADPVKPARRALDVSRLKQRTSGGAILFVLHALGGGTEQHAQEMATLLEAAGTAVFFSRPDDRTGLLYIEDPRTLETPNLAGFSFDTDVDYYAATLSALGVRLLHIHNMAAMRPNAANFFRHAARLVGVPYVVTLHDYGAICPRVSLIDQSGVYCGEPEVHICRSCIKRDGSINGKPDIDLWRASHEALLRGASNIFVPNPDVARRMRHHMPGVQYLVRPHPETQAPPMVTCAKSRPNEEGVRRVVLLGSIGPHKGSLLLERAAEQVLADCLPIKFIVVGYTDRDAALRACGVEITGPYAPEAAAAMLADAKADLAWLPAVWPETFSYTLTTILRQRIFPVVFDLGAPAERLRSLGWGARWPMEMMLDPVACVRELLNVSITPSPEVEEPYIAYPNPLRTYYQIDSLDAPGYSGAAVGGVGLR